MKKILFTITIIIFLLIVNDLLRSILDVWNKKDFVGKAEKELSYQKQLNNKLKSQLSFVQTPEFIEKEARDKLFMVKKDEKRIIIPEGLGESTQNPPTGRKENPPNWKKWWELFF
ncbi:MAG: septum formation initiator family protein [Candidatus Levybacteria bacterium]|nr:septum formation initiator family protein [Candidatus Levybacteria bacterium]